ncbi:MAG: hypothetical protein V1793_17350 [Pseudomonadota bacterium]
MNMDPSMAGKAGKTLVRTIWGCMMISTVLDAMEKLYKQRTTLTCLAAAAMVLVIDYITGRPVQFPIVYVLPIGMAAWQGKKTMAYAMALVLPLARVGFHFPWHETHLAPVAALNALIAFLALILYAFLVDRTAWQTRLLVKKVTVLEGILSICASCKRIRTEQGAYEQMEKYISEHSDATFSHGICPECAKKLYPEYYKGNGNE